VTAAFSLVHEVGPIWLALVWLVSIRWVHRDARTRLRNPRAIRTAVVVAAVLPLVGAVAWACVRPAETLVERRHRRLARLLLELETQPPLTSRAAAEPEQQRAAESPLAA
jgi:hypothetical protein